MTPADRSAERRIDGGHGDPGYRDLGEHGANAQMSGTRSPAALRTANSGRTRRIQPRVGSGSTTAPGGPCAGVDRKRLPRRAEGRRGRARRSRSFLARSARAAPSASRPQTEAVDRPPALGGRETVRDRGRGAVHGGVGVAQRRPAPSRSPRGRPGAGRAVGAALDEARATSPSARAVRLGGLTARCPASAVAAAEPCERKASRRYWGNDRFTSASARSSDFASQATVRPGSSPSASGRGLCSRISSARGTSSGPDTSTLTL